MGALAELLLVVIAVFIVAVVVIVFAVDATDAEMFIRSASSASAERAGTRDPL